MQKLIILSFFVISLFINSNVYAQKAKADTLNGVIDEYAHDSEGTLTAVVFSVLDKDFNTISYMVVNDAKGSELLDLVGENIDVIGVVKKNSDGTQSITVSEYFIPEEDEYPLPDNQDEQE